MTFKEHLQHEMNRLEERNERREAGQTRKVLLPLQHSKQIQHLIREICVASGEKSVE